MTVELRAATSIVFLIIMLVFWKPALKAASWSSDVKPWHALMGATWLLAGNRLTYAAAAQWDDNDAAVFTICQIYAVAAGMLMLFAGLWAIRYYRG